MMDKRFAIAGLIVAASCGHATTHEADWKPAAKVAPPFGLDRVRGGMTAQDARAAVPQLVVSTRDGDDVLALPMKVGSLVNIRLENGRVGDIVIRARDCASRSSALAAAWGPPRHMRLADEAEDVWSDQTTGWALAVIPAADNGCMLVFTSRDYFGTPGSAPGIVELSPPGGTAEDGAPQRSTSPGLFDRPVRVGVDPNSHVVSYVDILLSPAALEALRMAWGSGAGVGGEEVWLDRVHRRRAILTDAKDGWSHLLFEAYVPFDAWIVADRGLAPIPEGVLGASFADLQTRLPHQIRRDLEPSHDLPDGEYALELPTMEWSVGRGSHALLYLTAGVVSKIVLSAPCRDDAGCGEDLKVIASRWGTSTQPGAGVQTYRVGAKTISVSRVADLIQFTLTPG